MGDLRGMVIGVVKRRQYTFHDAMANKSDSRHGQRKEVETKVVVECGPPQPTYSLVTNFCLNKLC